MGATDAILEAADAGIELIVCITEGIPANDMVATYEVVQRAGARLIGPNCPGLLTPGQAKVGIIPGHIATPGPVGVVSKSGTLTYEAVDALTKLGLGQTTIVGIGGDPIIGTSFIDVLELFQADPETKAIVLIGEIGGTAEQEAAAYIKSARHQAGGQLYRRPDGTSRQAHGPRRRDHLGRRGHGPGEDRRARGGRRARRQAPDRHRADGQGAAGVAENQEPRTENQEPRTENPGERCAAVGDW